MPTAKNNKVFLNKKKLRKPKINIVRRRFEPSFLQITSPYIDIPPFYIFPKPAAFGKTFLAISSQWNTK